MRYDGRRPGRPAFIPTTTRRYMRDVARAAQVAMAGRGPHPGPFSISIRIELAPAKSWKRAEREAALRGERACCVKPDASNVQKLVEDALLPAANWSGCFVDDKNAVATLVTKAWGARDRIVVRVEPVGLPPVER